MQVNFFYILANRFFSFFVIIQNLRYAEPAKKKKKSLSIQVNWAKSNVVLYSELKDLLMCLLI